MTDLEEAGQAATGGRRSGWRRGLVSRFAKMRVPLWSLVLCLVVGGAATLAVFVLRDVPDFGNAIPHSERVEVVVHLCNERVDEAKLNPRTAELQLERELRAQGAKQARVTVQRRDCPSNS